MGSRTLKIFLYVLVGLAVVAGLWRFFPFIFQSRPLGYDAGLYRSMWLAYYQQLPYRELGALPGRIQQIYPAGSGLLGSLWLLLGGHIDLLLTWGVGVLSMLMGGALYRVVRPVSKQVALFSMILYYLSFIQRYVFWRGYTKQLLGMFFLLVILGLRVRQYRWQSLPVIIMLSITHRPGIALLGVLGVIYLIWGSYQKGDWKRVVSVGVVALLGTAVFYYPVREIQLLPYLQVIGSSIDIPSYNDGFQTSGTFLTTQDLLVRGVGLISLLLGLVGVVLSRRDKHMKRMRRGAVVGGVRVFGQVYFFQRMIGYADLFWIAASAYTLSVVWSYKKWWSIVSVIVVILSQASFYVWRSGRLWGPLISSAEFAFIQQIPTLVEDDAIIVVPGINYSPWVQGWTQLDVIAPGLYDLNERGNLSQEWQQHRVQASSDDKCAALQRSYGDLDRPLYVRLGVNQPRENLEDSCFLLVREGDIPWRQLWKVE